jgi:alpha-glucan,water dikinase
VALPFRVFDAVLALPENRASAHQFVTLLPQAARSPEPTLSALRACIRELELPAELFENLQNAFKEQGMPDLRDRAAAGACIKDVWASLWNDRAYFSRRNNGLSHDAVSMAVLIQEVVEAEYAFVIHTVNPATRDPNQVYAEIVCGLGETLVGNHPGRALSVAIDRKTLESTILAYPAKDTGLFGGGLIFRSDSNAEDLEGYAGAGLYDSVLLKPATERTLDYAGERLVWDDSFQSMLFKGIAKLAVEVEKAFGGPQDIEGAWVDGVFHVVQTRPQVGT